MEENGGKIYTILIYANGNNEFEPEMRQLMQQSQMAGSNGDVDIVLQTGRIEQKVLEIIRPSYVFDGTYKDDPGVKRYYLDGHEAVLAEALGNINMADSANLFDFIKWGMENYPAQHYILVMGGHVYQFVGINTDFSQDHPYIMGFPGMSTALCRIYESLKRKIDLLILDTCYMNTIEILYELGKENPPPVLTVLTYLYKGPFAGLPYHTLIESVQKHCGTEDLKSMIKKIIDAVNLNLIAFEIDHEILIALKRLFNDIACCYLTNKGTMELSPVELFTLCEATCRWHGFIDLVKDISRCAEQLVIYLKNESSVRGNITFAQKYLTDSRQLLLYNKLAFARENAWTELLSSKLPHHASGISPDPHPEPMILPLQVVYSYISMLNPGLTPEENKAILKKLYNHKKWDINPENPS